MIIFIYSKPITFHMEVRTPVTEDEFEEYYRVRWETLRGPWGQPVGSERLEDEDTAIHVMVVDQGRVVGVGRGHFNSGTEVQFRLMGVVEECRGKGVGTLVLEELERRALEQGAKEAVVQARDYAMDFYKKNGYEVVEKTHLLWGEIQHYRMSKTLT